MNNNSEDIAIIFYKFFRMIPVTKPELMEQVYRLRYQVYCLETGFENRDDFPNEQEKDDFDNRSKHFLIQHLATGSYAATTRLILSDKNNPDLPFPLEQHSQIERTDLLRPIARHQLAEVSRFCVSKDFKRRVGELGTVAGYSSEHNQSSQEAREEERRSFPLITLGLIASLIRMAVEYDTSYWYSTMEPTLIRLLKHMGICFIPLGPAIEYHGKRIPCIIKVQDLLDGVKENNLQGWNLLTDYGRFAKI